jgi:hypothetical protein
VLRACNELNVHTLYRGLNVDYSVMLVLVKHTIVDREEF